MADINEIKFSGIIERLQAITKRTGKPMSSWLLKVGRDQFKCVCFGNLAETVLQCRDGDQISLTGTGSINSWKDNDEHWHNDFQVSVWAAEIDGQEVRYQQADTGKQQQQSRQQAPQQQNRNEYDFQGGPF